MESPTPVSYTHLEMIIPSHHQIRPIDIGALLSGGITSIKVFKKPKVAIIPTGTEIIEPGQKMEVGSIIESNSRVFEGLVYELGGQPNRYLPIPDDYDLLKAKLLEAVMENDIVIINAGSSAGREDYTSSLIKELGEVLIHGIATKPGKPTILGIIKDKPVIGIPGYPVSGFFVFETFVQPLINSFLGQKEERVKEVEAIIAKRIVSSLQYKEFVRIKLGKVGDRLIATPLSRGAGVTMSLVRADGTLVIPQNSEGVEAGEKVKIKLLKDMEQIENTLVSIGSHDLIMDIISNRMQKSYDKHFLSSAHVGSMGGIMALKRGETHICLLYTSDYLAKQKARTLSGGERQKVALARAIIFNPSLLLLDEPTANIDPDSMNTMEDTIKKFNKTNGSTIIIVTHNPEQAKRLCDEIIVMDKGKIKRKITNADFNQYNFRESI